MITRTQPMHNLCRRTNALTELRSDNRTRPFISSARGRPKPGRNRLFDTLSRRMQDEIINKLRAFLLKSPINEEPHVVYLLTQVRKVFEWDSAFSARLPTLRFYCNWALHRKLDRGSADEFLNQVDPILTLQGNHDQSTHEKFSRLLTLETFRDEMRAFLKLNTIDSTFCDNDECWNAFLSAYSCVVENCEIAVQGAPGPPRGPLSLSVQSVSISSVKGRDVHLITNRPYPMDWTVTYTDGRSGRLRLSDHGLSGAVVDIR
jgi:hypothetical protein